MIQKPKSFDNWHWLFSLLSYGNFKKNLTFCVPFVITVTPGEITRKGREEIQHRPRDQHVIINTGKSGHDYHCNSQTYNRIGSFPIK